MGFILPQFTASGFCIPVLTSSFLRKKRTISRDSTGKYRAVIQFIPWSFVLCLTHWFPGFKSTAIPMLSSLLCP